MQSDRSQIGDVPAASRSAMTNGSIVLPGVDGRSTWVRRLRDLLALHVADLGGDDAISEAERSIIRRACVLTVELERMEVRFGAAGEAKSEELAVYVTTSNALRRLLETIGLERRGKDVTPHLAAYIAGKAEVAAS